MESDGKLMLTFRQAGLFAMSTFSKAIEFCYERDGSIIMSPLCGAVFSRDKISKMAYELKMENVTLIKLFNESTTAGGQYLDESDMSCAIVSMISATKRVE